MTTLTAMQFSTVEYIHKLRHAKFTEEQSEVLVDVLERQAQFIQEQQNVVG